MGALLEAFAVQPGEVVALAGGGGKTTAMFAMGYEAADLGYKVVLTTTTRIFAPSPAPRLAVLLEPDPRALASAVRNSLKTCPVAVAGLGLTPERKIIGVPQDITGLLLEAGADLVVVEADGANRKPFKAPRDGEPVLPDLTTLLIPVVGVDCLDQPLDQDHVHRPEIVARLTGAAAGELVSPTMVAAVLLHPAGYRRHIPGEMRWTPFINKVHRSEELSRAREIAAALGRGGARRVIIGAARERAPVAEVVEF
ncbi:MAG: selenium cofactor biosynthesis protein YqeC [Firmicutes bacterium]|nr:selenium cofactor biosynthesis protein YqeC [Bacillota bacterium]